jgi:hypothetical protein
MTKEEEMVIAFDIPKAAMKESRAVLELIVNPYSAYFGKMVLSNPIIPPTKALMITNRVNCHLFSFSPSWIGLYTLKGS